MRFTGRSIRATSQPNFLSWRFGCGRRRGGGPQGETTSWAHLLTSKTSPSTWSQSKRSSKHAVFHRLPALPMDDAAPKPLVAYRHNLFVHVGAASSIGNSGARWNTACYELLFDWLQREGEAFDVHACGHDVVSPCDPPPRKLPHPQRTAKTFGCDIALIDLPVGLVRARLLACGRPHVNGKARGLLPASADSRD